LRGRSANTEAAGRGVIGRVNLRRRLSARLLGPAERCRDVDGRLQRANRWGLLRVCWEVANGARRRRRHVCRRVRTRAHARVLCVLRGLLVVVLVWVWLRSSRGVRERGGHGRRDEGGRGGRV
jgi:hypothetical protein